MAIVKKRNEQTESRLLLESDEPVELPPAEIDERALVIQFEQHRSFAPELLEALRAGTTAELVPVMRDGATFAIHGATRTFWVKLWHSASSELTRIERAQIISCLPSTRGVRVITFDPDDDEDAYFEDDEESAPLAGDSEEGDEVTDERDAETGR